MQKNVVIPLTLCLSLGLAWVSMTYPLSAEEPGPATTNNAVATEADTPTVADDEEPIDPQTCDSLLEQVKDPAFKYMVNIDLLPAAISHRDSATMIDVVLQLVEAERILQRSHKTLDAEKLLPFAIKMAQENKDTASLDRLEKMATLLGKSDWLDQINLSKTLASNARGLSDEVLNNDGPTTEEVHNEYLLVIEDLKSARVLGNKGLVNTILANIENFEEFNDQQRKNIKAFAQEVLESMPETTDPTSNLLLQLGDENPSSETVVEYGTAPGTETVGMDKLLSVSRGSSGTTSELGTEPATITSVSSSYPLNVLVLKFCNANMGKKVGNGQCAVLNDQALTYAKAKRLPPTGSDADYVWGKKIATFSVSSKTGYGSILPGDMLQFRNATFYRKITASNGSWKSYSKSAAHHSAVVHSIGVKGMFLYALHQNSGGKLYVVKGWYDMRYLTAGYVWVYRPTK
jgi:hypothetical protein